MKTKLMQYCYQKVGPTLMTLMLFASATAFAQAGNGAGNGGDQLEMDAQMILSDIRSWILKGGYRQLKGAPQDYRDAMLEVLNSNYTLEYKTDEAFTRAYGAEKVCVNIDPVTTKYLSGSAQIIARLRKIPVPSEQERLMLNQHLEQVRHERQLNPEPFKVVCNRKTFPDDFESRYRLLHHEIAGLAMIEVNDNSATSDYYLSKQIGAFLEDVVVKRLRVAVTNEVAPVEEKPMLRCEGTWQNPKNEWTLKRRKDFIITAFENGDAYVTEMVRPLGATNSRMIVGGPRGHRQFRYSGIDKIAHFFVDYDQSPKVRVVKQQPIHLNELKVSFNSTVAQRVTIFGESLFLNFRGDEGGYLWRWDGSIGGMALKCESLSTTYSEPALRVYQEYLQSLSTKGWVRFTSAQRDQDDAVRMDNRWEALPPMREVRN